MGENSSQHLWKESRWNPKSYYKRYLRRNLKKIQIILGGILETIPNGIFGDRNPRKEKSLRAIHFVISIEFHGKTAMEIAGVIARGNPGGVVKTFFDGIFEGILMDFPFQ